MNKKHEASFANDYKKLEIQSIELLDNQLNNKLYQVRFGKLKMRQSQFNILMNAITGLQKDMNEVKSDIVELKKDMNEVKNRLTSVETILKRHDDLFVEHGWLKKSSFHN